MVDKKKKIEKICPFMSFRTPMVYPDHKKDEVIETLEIPCLEENCALWISRSKCCSFYEG